MDGTEDLINVWQPGNPLDNPDWTVGVSLSGGGYRATAFAIGALVALHDVGAWGRIRWISSVSGGSFASAAAGLRLPLDPARDDINQLVESVVKTITSRGSLVAWRRTNRTPADGGPLGRIYAGGVQRSWTARPDGSQALLVDLVRDDRLHIFMAADLASSLPIALGDRFIFSEGMADEWQIAYRPGTVSLATAVRASATFPGLPAVRVKPGDLGESLEPADHDLLLVDGGTWNNLGTDWRRVARWFDRGNLLPAAIPREVNLHLVVLP